ncbi:hypothetical protein [Shewanella baltica]|uniref:hypothetical protein n=1 Tax=Shewanella baltica TaxID=62322 RepID=UPI0039B04BCC
MKKNYTSALAKSFETKWFANKTPDLFNLYNQVIEYLLSQYEGDNHRAIKGHGATPIYKFNKQVPNIESEISRISVKPKAQSVEVRFSPSIVNNIKLKKNLDSKNIKFKSRKNHVGEDIIGIEVNVYSTNDINLIEDLLTNYSVANFKSKPSYYYESSMQPP